MAEYDWMAPLLQTGASLFASNQAQNNQTAIANATNATAQAAADAAAFRPVGITSRFGSSGFQYDPQGRLTGAGYQVAPDIAAQREALLGLSGGALTQAGQVQGLTAPSQQAASGLFGLGSQFLPTSTNYSASPEAGQYASFLRNQANMAAPTGFSRTASPEAQGYYNQLSNTAAQVMPTSYDPTAAAQQYMQQQQGLLAPGREQQLAGLRNNLQQTGRSGLATGATSAGGRDATNPEMAAYYNSIAQQDAQLGANSMQQARANLQSDIGLSSQLGGTGLNALNASQQQALTNSLNMGQFASGQMGTALQSQQSADEIARQRMLSNISTGTGLYNQGLGLLNAGYGTQQAALAPYSSYLGGAQTIEGLGQQSLTTGSGLGSSAAAAGAQQGSLLNAGQRQAYGAQQNAAGYQNAATTGMLSGAIDPIAQLIRGLGGSSSLPAFGATGNSSFGGGQY